MNLRFKAFKKMVEGMYRTLETRHNVKCKAVVFLNCLVYKEVKITIFEALLKVFDYIESKSKD